MNNILGISFFIWGFVCLGVALIYAFVWPKPKKTYKNKFPGFVLRWFHSLVWVILAGSSFLQQIPEVEKRNIPPAVAALALIVYIIFIIVFLKDQSNKGLKAEVKHKK